MPNRKAALRPGFLAGLSGHTDRKVLDPKYWEDALLGLMQRERFNSRTQVHTLLDPTTLDLRPMGLQGSAKTARLVQSVVSYRQWLARPACRQTGPRIIDGEEFDSIVLHLVEDACPSSGFAVS